MRSPQGRGPRTRPGSDASFGGMQLRFSEQRVEVGRKANAAPLQLTLYHRLEFEHVGIADIRQRLGGPFLHLPDWLLRLRQVGVDLLADLGALIHPVARVRVPVSDDVTRRQVPLELCRKLGERQLFIVGYAGIPDDVEVARLAEEGDGDLAPALVAGPADMERLMKVANQVDDPAKGGLLVGKG